MLRSIILSMSLLALTITAGADDSLVPVKIQLQWVPQAQFAGYYVAQAMGFYAEEGLDVAILESEGDIQPLDAVAAGAAEFGVTWVPRVLKANEGGANLVNIAQIFQRSGTVLVSFAETGIVDANDIVLKRIGYWPGGSEFEVYALTFHIGSDPVSGEHLLLVEQPFHVGPLLEGELDAAQALIYNGYGRLLGEVNPASGELYTEDELNIINFNELGLAMLQDHIIASADWLAQAGNEDVAAALLRATLRGWIHCRDEADNCVRLLREIDPELGESHQQWQMNEVNKLIWPSPAGIGVMDEALWDQTVEWMLRIGALTEEPAAGSYRSDMVTAALESLAAEGLDVTGVGWQPADVTVRAGGE